jgi:mono/diheme cytochrome c family protein
MNDQRNSDMRNHLLTCTAIVLSMSIPPARATETIDSTGPENFARYCAACHGDGGKGDGPVASAIAKPIPDLTRIAERNNGKFPRQIIKNAIDGRWQIDAHGTKKMPVWGFEFWINEGAGDFSETQVSRILDGLVDHIESIQAP